MRCRKCDAVLGHEIWCTRHPQLAAQDQSTEVYAAPSLGDALELPENPSPTSWLMKEIDDLHQAFPMVDPNFDLSLLEGESYTGSLLSLLEVGETVSTNISVATPAHQVAAVTGTAENGLGSVGSHHFPMGPMDVIQHDHLYASDSSLGSDDNQDEIPIIIPGWNVSESVEIQADSVSAGAWPTAMVLAEQLIAEGTMDNPNAIVEPIGRAEPSAMDIAEPSAVVRPTLRAESSVVESMCEHVLESPASPDPESGEEARSEASSGAAASEQQNYAPSGSDISEAFSPHTPPSPPPRLIGVSPIQKYWSRTQAKPGGSRALARNRIAMVQPRKKCWGPMAASQRHRRNARVFRIVTEAPVVTTQSTISRVVLPDGSCTYETLDTRFDMAVTRSTQTITPLFADVQTGTSPDRPPSVVIIRVGRLVSSAVPEESAESACPTSPTGEADQGDVTPGTPLQDE
jgi:hypothetical protein